MAKAINPLIHVASLRKTSEQLNNRLISVIEEMKQKKAVDREILISIMSTIIECDRQTIETEHTHKGRFK
jgi:hypothetical protein